MAKYLLEDLYEYFHVSDAFHPVKELKRGNEDYDFYEIDLTDEEYARYMEVYEEWKAWNLRFREVHETEEQKAYEAGRVQREAEQENRDRDQLKKLIEQYGVPK